jgi:hypothetical protein
MAMESYLFVMTRKTGRRITCGGKLREKRRDYSLRMDGTPITGTFQSCSYTETSGILKAATSLHEKNEKHPNSTCQFEPQGNT